MLNSLQQFAAEATEAAGESNLLETLGINWEALLWQSIAFIILVILLAKFVYPPIVAMLDRHDKSLEDSAKATKDAKAAAEKAEASAKEQLSQARDQAASIIATADKESAEIIADAEEKAKAKAKTIMEGAEAELRRETELARKALRGEAVELVAAATEKVVDSEIASADQALIEKTLERCKK